MGLRHPECLYPPRDLRVLSDSRYPSAQNLSDRGSEAGWERQPENHELHARLKSYARREPPLKAAAAPDPSEQERLRALGYLPPEFPVDVARSHTEKGLTAERVGDEQRAILHYRKALQAVPQHLEASNNLAWILATTERSGLRDPKAAVELAETALAHDPNSPAILDTLAASYAAAKRLPEAVATQRLAIESLSTSNETIVAEFRARLAKYRSQVAEADD